MTNLWNSFARAYEVTSVWYFESPLDGIVMRSFGLKSLLEVKWIWENISVLDRKTEAHVKFGMAVAESLIDKSLRGWNHIIAFSSPWTTINSLPCQQPRRRPTMRPIYASLGPVDRMAPKPTCLSRGLPHQATDRPSHWIEVDELCSALLSKKALSISPVSAERRTGRLETLSSWAYKNGARPRWGAQGREEPPPSRWRRHRASQNLRILLALSTFWHFPHPQSPNLYPY